MVINMGFIKLPPGYHIEWYEGDEHYHWVNGERESIMFSSRWQAYRAAWKDYELHKCVMG
uniref:Uncharacterized protein n=1 Tax=viral metagenome TaxID=1070528 RepID=A0A6M3JSD5_9ZZZZ